MTNPEPFLAELRALLGPRGLATDDETLGPQLSDWRKVFIGKAMALALPASTEEVAAIVSLAGRYRVPIVPQGGNTGLVGGATPDTGGDALMVNLRRMNRIRSIDPLNHTITAEAGCILADIQRAADNIGQFFPLSLGAEGSCQIGGNLATNAGGINVLRYGNARDLTLGLEVVLPDGPILSDLKGLRKDNTGYDLKQLFIGSEGTLGIITAAVLKLYPKLLKRVTAFAALRDLDASIDLFNRCRAASGDQLVSFELIPLSGIELAIQYVTGTVNPIPEAHDYFVLIEAATSATDVDFEGIMERALGEALSDGLILDAVIAETEARRAELWRLREAIVEGQRLRGGSVKHDVAVKVADVPAFIAEASRALRVHEPLIGIVPFGHLGDGNIHFNLIPPPGADNAAFQVRAPEFNRLVHDVVARFGGSVSAEHGIGQLRRGELATYKSPVAIELMRRIKRILDPDNLMNPGKVL